MELNNLFGLPAHPLLVHLPVVFVPMASIAAIILAIFPKYLGKFGWWVTGASFIGMVGAVLAAGSGEELEHKVAHSATLEHHGQLGETARLLSFVLFAVMLIVMLVRRYRPALIAKKAAGIVASVLIVAASVAAGWAMIATGHNGAKASWCEVSKNCPVSTGTDTTGDSDEG
ncbi:MAG: DUF2231 domain-containing protein [Actinomycetes bacterium]